MNDSRSQLDAHSFYGTLQCRASNLYYKQIKQRPLIISRSTFAGHGKYASHWLGDNHAKVEDMTISVVSSMKFNIFGIPLVGADICGFSGNQTTPELCARWHQIGAFQPFSRNHRDCKYSQEPWRFNETFFDNKTKTSYMDIMKQAIQRKYHLLRYYYTQMSQLSFGNNTQSTVYKPLFFEFPEDPGAYTDIPNNVMIGQALKTSVNAVNLTQTETEFYFPAGTWCSLFEPVGDCITTEIGQTWPLPSSLNDSFVHIREGFVVPMQDATKLKANTTVDLQNSPVDLHILGQYRVPGIMSWAAEGLYVNDDGLTVETEGNVNQYYMKATYTQQQPGQVETITVQFLQRMIASNYFNATNNCSSVNAADWLQTLYIYNADSFKQHDTWFAMVSYTDSEGEYYAIGTAEYDQKTNRIILDKSQEPVHWVCLTRAFRLVLTAQG
jgi:alpha-glucosidase (family GH31 glycosyl hydrolase)